MTEQHTQPISTAEHRKLRIALRDIVHQLIQKHEFDCAKNLLDTMADFFPDPMQEQLLQISVLSRMKNRSAALAEAQALFDAHPENPRALQALLQLYLPMQRNDEAVEAITRFNASRHDPITSPHVFHVILLALHRSEKHEEVYALYKSYRSEITAASAAILVQTAHTLGRIAEAITIGEQSIEDGEDAPALRGELARAYLEAGNYERAIAHCEVLLAEQPDNTNMQALMGELLLIKGRPQQALEYILPCMASAEHLTRVRLLAARAYKALGEYGTAAEHMLAVSATDPDNIALQRQTVASLNQAGLREHAADMFHAHIEKRRAKMPKNFDEGLRFLWQRIDDVEISAARLDWAWSMRDTTRYTDRTKWEREAKWGYLADQYLYDWLECKTHAAEEIMWHLADLERHANRLNTKMAGGKGIIIAGAHIGPLYAVPLAMELMNFNSKWLASTPSIPGMLYQDRLISTSDQTESQVVRQSMQALATGHAFAVAVDGAMTMAAPRIAFEGQEITYSAFVPKLAQKQKISSVFATPIWRDGKLDLVIYDLPDAAPDEPADAFATRWREAYLACLREQLSGPPENLRLSGGLWRHVKAKTYA